MTNRPPNYVGFTCAYTPLPILDAAGFVPFRVLPLSEASDQAGSLIHDNMCPHVKRILDRALENDLPDLCGIVIIESCDTMRRLADAWQTARPNDRLVRIDLPVTADRSAVTYYAGQLRYLIEQLATWSGKTISDSSIHASIQRYNELETGLARARAQAAKGSSPGGWSSLQKLANDAVTGPIASVLERLESVEAPGEHEPHGVPVFLFGNVLADPRALDLLATCGAQILDDDICTGARQITAVGVDPSADPVAELAGALLRRSPCARSMPTGVPENFANHISRRAKECGARGAIAHVMKFCDPYLARLPAIRSALRDVEIPLLVLEGDCTLRSLGQHRTRIEAFVEMLGE